MSKKKILFVTIPHTGTRFYLDLMSEVLGTPTNFKEPGGSFYYHHTHPLNIPRFTELVVKENFEVITTHRDLYATQASWLRRFPHREDKVAELDSHIDVYYDWVLPRASLVLSIEPELRELSLEALNAFLNANLTTDWTPIGHHE